MIKRQALRLKSASILCDHGTQQWRKMLEASGSITGKGAKRSRPSSGGGNTGGCFSRRFTGQMTRPPKRNENRAISSQKSGTGACLPEDHVGADPSNGVRLSWQYSWRFSGGNRNVEQANSMHPGCTQSTAGSITGITLSNTDAIMQHYCIL